VSRLCVWGEAGLAWPRSGPSDTLGRTGVSYPQKTTGKLALRVCGQMLAGPVTRHPKENGLRDRRSLLIAPKFIENYFCNTHYINI
jgi:hypothetical protein